MSSSLWSLVAYCAVYCLFLIIPQINWDTDEEDVIFFMMIDGAHCHTLPLTGDDFGKNQEQVESTLLSKL